MPDDPVYVRNYGVGGLFERLRDDQGLHPDTMDQRFGAWATLLSTFRLWARFFGSSFKDDLRYTPTSCFETFPFPEGWQTDPALEAAGESYYSFRAALMVRNDEGLTATYNRFHDPDERAPDILQLRELHAAMDRAVLDAYGWHDISTDCVFRLDYEIDEETWGTKKKPWRYRWPEAVHDDSSRAGPRPPPRSQPEALRSRAHRRPPRQGRQTEGREEARQTEVPQGRRPQARKPGALPSLFTGDDE